MMIEELITRVFCTRNYAHVEHWKIRSGYNHETLGDFYEEIISALDSIVEAHIGIFGDITIDSFQAEKQPRDIVKCLDDDLVWIHKNRQSITNKLPAIDNLLQDLEASYMKALFKLRTKN